MSSFSRVIDHWRVKNVVKKLSLRKIGIHQIVKKVNVFAGSSHTPWRMENALKKQSIQNIRNQQSVKNLNILTY